MHKLHELFFRVKDKKKVNEIRIEKRADTNLHKLHELFFRVKDKKKVNEIRIEKRADTNLYKLFLKVIRNR